MEFDLVICTFACDTVDKYRNQILKINETWGREAESHPNVKLLYFLGEEKTSLVGSQYINLPDVKNDYTSCSYKQFLGLKHIYENYKPKFIICIGTDTYINIPKLLKYLSLFNHTQNIYIGGHGDSRTILGKNIYYHSGGPGFVITQECLRLLYPKLETLMDDWSDVCSKNDFKVPNYDFRAACDVAIAYYLQMPEINSYVIKTNDLSFSNCNYKGHPCHQHVVNMKDSICCHLMSPNDFDEFTQILKLNNYFI